jgi:pyruvate formate lyase activating enzyme
LVSLIAPLEPFIDGITFSGGECCLQGPFLLEAAASLHELRPDLGVIADTNGSLEAEPFASLLAGLDGFIFDLKAWNEAAHVLLTGLPMANVTRNLEAAAAAGKLVEVRTVLIAGVNDSDVDILASARYFAELGGGFPWRLLPFRPQGARGDFASLPSYPRSGFEAALKLARSVIGNRAIGPAVSS